MRFPGFDHVLQRGDHVSEVVGVNAADCVPALEFFDGLAEILQNGTVDELEFAGHRHGTDQGGEIVHHQTKVQVS